MPDSIYHQITAGWPKGDIALFPEESFHYYESTGSTNDDVLKILKTQGGGDFTLVVADFQDAGRGRRGDRWEAAMGRNLLFSLAVRLGENRAHWTRLPMETAVAVGEAVEAVLDSEMKISAKWPNDIYLQDRKLAGILVETVLTPEPFGIVGVGLNVNMRKEEIGGDLKEIAISLYEVLGCESSRWFILGLFLRAMIRLKTNKDTKFIEILTWLRERDYLKGKSLVVHTGNRTVEGKGAGLGPAGELLVATPTGRLETIVSAEKIWAC